MEVVWHCCQEFCALVNLGKNHMLFVSCMQSDFPCVWLLDSLIVSTFMFQIFVIPVLIGLLFELLVIVPMRVPVDESPVFLLYQDWALGLIFLKIWTRLVRIISFYIPPTGIYIM